MKSKIFLRKVVLICAIMSLFIFIFSIKEGFALNSNHESKSISLNFEMLESSILEGYSENVSSIDFDLPNSSWSVDDIELNFTNIDFGNESKIIEDNDIGQRRLMDKSKSIQAFGIQLKILDSIILYGVQIYGNVENYNPISILYIQINGYNAIDNTPNQIINASTILNISTTLGWYNQKFQDPLYLIPGNYYLVLNGTEFLPSDNSDYYWHYNDVNPQYSSLNTSYYDGSIWILDSPKTPFLVKLNQKLNQSIFPEEINMSAQINGESFKVSNGNAGGKGYLKKDNINYHPNNKTIKIKVKNNKTNNLEFNLLYNLTINNYFKAVGSVNVEFNNSNQWNINPEITKVSDYHTVKFNYPKSWTNLKVLKNGIDISSNITMDLINYSIIIPNNFIENYAFWEILATSPNIEFNIYAPKTNYITGQELSFSITSPLAGNYTFLLIDPIGLEEYQMTKEIPSQGTTFSYTIPSNSIEGNYIAYIFWNNKTDAGVQSQVFIISLNTIPTANGDFSLYLTFGLILISGGVIGGSSYVAIRKIKSNRRSKLKQILEQCNDILNLKYVIVLDAITGIDLFSKSFEEKEVDPTLISGFLQAIHNFGVEVIEGAKDSRTVKVDYKNSFIIMTEFINLRLIVIMKSNPSKNFLYAIESLAYHIYKYYGKVIDKFEGNLKPFRSIQKLIDSDLNLSIRYPLKLSISKDIKLTQDEKEMVEKASKFMIENNFKYFYAIYLLPDNVYAPKDYETILSLIKKGVFQPDKELK
ncbi:MAG: hypothetical protein ACFFDX_09545 [Candidatus Odinarchaeota archaeon]